MSDRRRRSRWMWTCVAVGGVFVFLGIVNAALGHAKIREYTEVIALLEASEPTRGPTTLRRLDGAERKLAFYGTVERGGAWMAMAGAGLVLFGLGTGGADRFVRRREPSPSGG